MKTPKNDKIHEFCRLPNYRVPGVTFGIVETRVPRACLPGPTTTLKNYRNYLGTLIPPNQTKNWLSLTSSYPFNQTEKWLSLTRWLGVPSSPESYPLNQTHPYCIFLSSLFGNSVFVIPIL